MKRVQLAVLMLGMFGTTASLLAQPNCIGPDGLNGNCCQPVQPNLPQFPGAATPGLGVCWTHCTPSAKQDIRVLWQTPVQAPCAEFTTAINVFDATTGAMLMSGKLTLDYTRTWMEADVSGVSYQVWRFVAKADLQATTTAAAAVCPVPRCLAPFGNQPSAFFYGYVDYAASCGPAAQPFQITTVLFHACDFFIHKPGFSSRPGVFHPDESYAIIGHPVGQSFNPMNFPAPGGALTGEAWRNVPPPGAACVAEDPVQGQMAPFINACLCAAPTLTPPQVTLRQFNGKGTCVDPVGQTNSWQSQAISFPTLPWFHMVTHSLGCFNSPQIYPGQECVAVDEGLFSDHDLCQNKNSFEVFYGGSSIKGWQVISSAGTVASQNFTDIADNYSNPGGPTLPLFGNVMPTQHLIYVNVP